MQIPEEIKIHDSTETERAIELTKTVGIQTVYRESEAQTDPYSPEFTVKPGHDPEVLAITYFTYGNGLPASMAEMELIEQAREKRLFEAMLPSSTDEACFALRRKLMDEQEFKQWAKRESDIKRIQSERLELLHTALLDREKENEERNQQRVEELRLKKTEFKDRTIAKIGRKRIKVLRKMFKHRKSADELSKRRDIVDEYGNFGSTMYAGITRDGMSLDKLANKYEVQPEVLTTYQGLKELSETLPTKTFKSTINIKSERDKIEKSYTRKENAHRAALLRAQKALDDIYNPPSERDESKLPGRHSIGDFKERPDTPKVERSESEEEEKRYTAAVLLQRLLRGRAIQNAMYEGKEKRLDLIVELRRTGEMIELTESEKERELLLAHTERVMDGFAEAIQGEFVSSALDRLSKELVRLKEERKIAAVVKLAERKRREKECEESGRRQAEEILRSREDALFREVMDTHQGTVDTFLQNILSTAVQDVAWNQAMEEANLRAFQLNRIVDTLEDRMNRPEMIVRDLVSAFLIPEVERAKIQRQVKFEQKRYLLAARQALQETAKQAKRQVNTMNAAEIS